MSAEARDWDEYLAWTRGADPGQYAATEELAWQRLQSAALRRRIVPYSLLLQPRDDPQGEDGTKSLSAGDVDTGPERA